MHETKVKEAKSATYSELERHFARFRENVVGASAQFVGPYGERKILYADWIASGRLYAPIERKLSDEIGPLLANTHTETSYTGSAMTQAYEEAKHIIKKHVNASADDVLIPTGTGMTGAVIKLQRMMGLKLPEQFQRLWQPAPNERPVVFVSHMEHHSNQTSWYETLAEVVVIPPSEDGLMDLDQLDKLLEQYADRAVKIASITSCSNVTGISTPYHGVAKRMHQAGGLCFVDFACSGPYVKMDMHPEDPEMALDAIFFSPHKCLGGPGTPGILIFNKKLYANKVPDNPGGGTVQYTSPWGIHRYIEDIETREDGGTPGFMQTIKAALALKLKEEMDMDKIHAMEAILVKRLMQGLNEISGIEILAGQHQDRLGAISFYHPEIHYNLLVRMLNDRFGIQVRGGCSCAGTYGHYLLNIDRQTSEGILAQIDGGDISARPGWVRISLHPTMTLEEVDYIVKALRDIVENKGEYAKDYRRTEAGNDFQHVDWKGDLSDRVNSWFYA